jgi:hypothetical protein
MDHSWDPSSAKWKLKSVAQSPGDLHICMVDFEEQVNLKRVESEEAVKTLGVMLNMEGMDNEQEFICVRKVRTGRN